MHYEKIEYKIIKPKAVVSAIDVDDVKVTVAIENVVLVVVEDFGVVVVVGTLILS